MHKIILILSVIFIVSCGIQDDNNIAENIHQEDKTESIEQNNIHPENEINNQNTIPDETSKSGENLNIGNNEENQELSTNITEDSKDLGNGFIIQNTKNSTVLLFDNQEIKDFKINENIETLPFVFDEGCNIFTRELLKTNTNLTYEEKEKIWNNFTKNEKIKCLQENYLSSVEIKNLYPSIFIIQKNGYEWSDVELFNTQTKQLLKNGIVGPFFDFTKQYNNSIYTINSTGRGNTFVLLKINNNSIEKIAETTEDSIIFSDETFEGNYPEFQGFTFKNDDFIVYYTLDYQKDVQQKIID